MVKNIYDFIVDFIEYTNNNKYFCIYKNDQQMIIGFQENLSDLLQRASSF